MALCRKSYQLYRAYECLTAVGINMCYLFAFVGFCLLMSDFLGVSLLLPDSLTPLSSAGVLLMLYGLYYGVLSRDLCALCSMNMAVSLGYVSRKGEMPSKTLPANTCAIYNHPQHASVRLTDSRPREKEEPTFSTPCGHHFNPCCLRGWTIIGKRDTSAGGSHCDSMQ